MIKTVLLIFALVVGIPAFAQAQETFSSKVWAFDMQVPKGWFPMSKAQRDENIGKIEFSEEAQRLIMERDKGFTFLTGYRKYEPAKHPGLIPSIQVMARKKTPATFEAFRRQITKSWTVLNETFTDFKIVEDTDIEISGIKATKTIATFTVKSPDGVVLNARTRIYAIPRDTYFFQITFNDGAEVTADCSAEFDALARTISIKR